MRLFFIIVFLSQVCLAEDIVFNDVEYELRAHSDRDFVIFLKEKKEREKKQNQARIEHKLMRKKTLEQYKKSIQEQVKIRASGGKKVDSDLEKRHMDEELKIQKFQENLRAKYVEDQTKQKLLKQAKSKAIKEHLKNNLHILKESISPLERVEKNKRQY